MLYREVPKNGDKLSILGYGAMRLPGKGQRIDEELATKQLYAAIDGGINYIDTAYPYHNGKSEPFLGKALSKDGYREKVKIATKLPHWSTNSKKDMEEILDKQLANLQVDCIDYYLIHALDGEGWEKCKQNGVIEFLDGALASKKIKNAGFSFHGAAKDFNTIVDDYDWVFCQIQYNYLDRNNQAGIKGLKYAASKNMAVIIMEPLRGGNLGIRPPKEIQKIWDKSDNKRSPAEWSFRWLWNQPEVTVVLSGMNIDEHIEENIKIASEAEANSLTEQEVRILKEAAKTFRKIMKVGCTSCQYCMPCSSGVNIPLCFEKYNSYHTFGDKQAKLMYTFMTGGVTTKPGLASQCTECGECVEKCPQKIPIPDKLKEVKNDMEGYLTKPFIWFMKLMFKVKRK